MTENNKLKRASSSTCESVAARLCPRCKARSPVFAGEPLLPSDWHSELCGHAVFLTDGIPQYAPTIAGTLTGFDPASFALLAQREPGHFWFEPRNRLLVGLADRYF